MKKLFTILCAGLLTLSLSAQIYQRDAGTWYIEGRTNVDWTTTAFLGAIDDDGNEYDASGPGTGAVSKLALDGMGGFFVADGFIVGLSLNHSSQATINNYIDNSYPTSKIEQDNPLTITSFVMGPVIRYYIANSGGYINTGYLFGSSRTYHDSKETGVETNTEAAISQLIIGGGYAFALNDYVALPMGLTYSMITHKNKDSDYSKLYGALGFRIGLAVLFY